MESLYQEIILDHYRNPLGRGLRVPFEAEVHHVNPTCGDEITLRVHVSGSGPQACLLDVSYDNQGCSISQSSASMMFELVAGGRVDEALAVGEEFRTLLSGGSGVGVEPDEDSLGDTIAFSGVAKYPARVKCALLPWMALRDALARADAPTSQAQVSQAPTSQAEGSS